MSGKKPHHLSRARESTDDTGWCEALEGLPAVDEPEDAQAQVLLTSVGSELTPEQAFSTRLEHAITALQVEARAPCPPPAEPARRAVPCAPRRPAGARAEP